MWNCECPICHKVWEVRGSHLNEPKPVSMCKTCSSLKNLSKIKTPFFKDLTGQKFGKLTVIERTNKKGRTYFWKCLCDCGNICEKEAQYLLNGDTLSCGCLRSKQENEIEFLLKNHNIIFEKEKVLFKKYRFDFYVNNNYIIEYDGIQHFQQITNREPLSIIRERDLEKNQYCFNNNIILIRIPYNQNFYFEDLIPETSRFIFYKGALE